ncbi:MAG: hypothetical protein ACJ71K_08790 [Nitrososphaeraceae archaeon]|jgi:hypothetical protein
MTSNQRVEYFPNTVRGDKRTPIERINEFIAHPDRTAISISAIILAV